MHTVFLGIGSNIKPVDNIKSGLTYLRGLDETLVLSKTYQSESSGFEGPDFLNLVAKTRTSKSIPELIRTLKDIERAHGREPLLNKHSSRTLDIDVLTYDDLQGDFDGMRLPRPEIIEQAYVLRPFAELAPDTFLPGSTCTLGILWAAFDEQSQPLTEMSVCW
jgi:2-amino-4-hydroxy-6-hydroxymethyldihydropteridine diphosphokinase